MLDSVTKIIGKYASSKLKLKRSIWALLLLCVAFTGKAQIRLVDISGNGTVCAGTTCSYSITSSITPHIQYKWSLSGYGKIVATSSSAVQVLWKKAGTATLHVDGGDEKNRIVEKGTFQVMVKPLPIAPNALLGPDTVCFETAVTFTAKSAKEGTLFEWAAPGGICNFTSGDSTEATFSGKSPATIMVWRVADDAPHCNSDTLKKLVYRHDVNLRITGVDSVCPNSLAVYRSSCKNGENYEWKIYDDLAGSVDTNGRDSVRILWNDIPPGYPIMLRLRARKCDLYYADTFRINLKKPAAPTKQSVVAKSKKDIHAVKLTKLSPFIARLSHYATCANDTRYSVSLIDNSDYLGGHAPYKYEWYVNSKEIDSTTTPGYHIVLPPGAYLLGERVYYGDSTDNSFATDSIYLEPMPVARFTYTRDTTCAKEASVHFLDSSVSQSPLTYEWNFGDFVHNTVKNPFKVFALPGFFRVTLKVTNSYGCLSSDTQHVWIRMQTSGGNLIGGGVYTDSAPVFTAFIPSPHNDFLENYCWMRDGETLSVSRERHNYVSRSGRYWVNATNHLGCYSSTPATNINIIHPPHASIRQASKTEYGNVPYTLNGWAGDDTTITYKWFKNGNLVGMADTYTDKATNAGADTFQLVISASCYGKNLSDTSKPYIVEVRSNSPP
jgi:hypothetical protein